MGNTFPSPFTSADLAAPSDADPGDDVAASLLTDLGLSLNYLHAAGNAGVVVSQTFEDSLCAWNTTTKQTAVCTWRVPVLSTAHTQISVEIRATASTADASVIFNLGGTSVSITVTHGAASTYYTDAAKLTSGGAGTDIITMDLWPGTGGIVTVDHVRISIDPLTTPLGTSAVGDFEPFGADSLLADYCLPAHRGAQIIDAIEELKLRPRVLFSWSGLSQVSGYTNAVDTMDAHDHSVFAPAILGALDDGQRYDCKALLVADGSDETRFRLGTSSSPDHANDNEILIAAGGGTAWEDLAADGESGEGAELDESDMRLPGLPGAPIHIQPNGSLGESPTTSSAGIKSVTVWGA